MSVLTRLVARATGQAAPGLTPRLPGRFELGGGGVEPPLVEDWTHSTPRGPAADPGPPPPQTPPPQRLGSTTPAHERFATDGPAPQTDPPAPQAAQSLTPPIATPDSTPPRPQLPLAPRDPTIPTRTDREPPVRREAPRHPPPPRTGEGEPAIRRQQQGALEQLLPGTPPPPARAPQPSPPHGPLAPPQRGTPVGRIRRASAPEPPEITVHIGRIEVVMAPEPRQGATRRETRQPPMTDLADYLRGRESGR